MTLRVIAPVKLTPDMLVSSNVPENEYPMWDSATTYALADRVISGHQVFESVQAANVNHPTTAADYWLLVGPTNRWRAWDDSRTTATVQANSIVYEILPGTVVSSLVALEMKGQGGIHVTMTDPANGVVYDKTVPVQAVQPESDWWSFFYADLRVPAMHLINDLPSYPSATLRIEVTGGAELAIGVLLVGIESEFGLGVKQGAKLSLVDYSRKETNDFGDTVLKKRASARRMSIDVLLTKAEVDKAMDFFDDLRATPALWMASKRYDSTTLYGFYKSFEVGIEYFDYSECSIDIEGLT